MTIHPSQDVLQAAIPIIQGLLASGHFTETDDEKGPRVKNSDAGKDWKADGFYKRFPSEAVIIGIDLANELIEQVQLDAKNKNV